jgi:ATP-dependent DNA ligase
MKLRAITPEVNGMEEPLTPLALRSERLEEGPAMFRHACVMGLEGMVSKRADSHYKSGRCSSWVKIQNPRNERR